MYVVKNKKNYKLEQPGLQKKYMLNIFKKRAVTLHFIVVSEPPKELLET